MSDCLFCGIVQKKIKTDVVYRDRLLTAFNDIDPQAPFHILIVPNKHIATLNHIQLEDTDLLGSMVQLAKKLALERDFAQEGYRILFNCNRAGGQTVDHIHLHLLGGRIMCWPPG